MNATIDFSTWYDRCNLANHIDDEVSLPHQG